MVNSPHESTDLLLWQHRTAKLVNRLRTSGWIRVPEIAWPLRHAISPPGNEELLHKKFFGALVAGFFNRGGRTRVLLLNESKPSTELRLTPKRAQDAVQNLGWNGFVRDFSSHAWIEFGPVYNLIKTWLDSLRVPGLRNSMIDHSLRELTELAALIPAAPIADGPLAIQQLDGAAPMAGAKPKNRTNKQRDAETAWDRRLCEMIARGEQPDTRDKVKAIAENEFGALLSDRAFERVWAHRATPEMKKPGPRGSRKSPQS